MRTIQSFDGHVHTNRSDGLFPPEEVLRRARDAGVRYLAITDHDRTNPDYLRQSRESGIQVISGAEISAYAYLPPYKPECVHLCAYFIDPEDPQLCRLLAAHRGQDKMPYLQAVLAKLNQLHLPLTLEEVLADGGGHLSRKAVARAMVRLGYVKSVREAFEVYLGGKRPGDKKLAYVDRDGYYHFASMEVVIETVRQAHGIVSLAHPCLYGLDHEQLRRLIAAFAKAAGPAGALECNNISSTLRQREKLLRMANEFDLLAACGSDFHGEEQDCFYPGNPELYHRLRSRALALYPSIGE